MRPILRRALVGVAAAATVAAAAVSSASPALAENVYHPSDADFADCPAKPAGATGTWTCYVQTVLDGTIKFKNLNVQIDQPVRLTTAQGRLADGGTAAAYGGLTGGPLSITTPIPGSSVSLPDLTGTKVQLYGTGLVKPGLLLPSAFGVKMRLVNPLVGNNCYVGSDAAPIELKPQIALVAPWIQDTTPMLKAWSSENGYALPGAKGCGLSLGLIDSIINSRFSLPSAAGNNHADWTWVVRTKAY